MDVLPDLVDTLVQRTAEMTEKLRARKSQTDELAAALDMPRWESLMGSHLDSQILRQNYIGVVTGG